MTSYILASSSRCGDFLISLLLINYTNYHVKMAIRELHVQTKHNDTRRDTIVQLNCVSYLKVNVAVL